MILNFFIIFERFFGQKLLKNWHFQQKIQSMACGVSKEIWKDFIISMHWMDFKKKMRIFGGKWLKIDIFKDKMQNIA